MTQFSPDLNPSPRGTGPSQRMRQASKGASHGQPGGGGHPPGQKAHKQGHQGQGPAGHKIGRPQPPEQAPAPAEDPNDLRHVHLLAQWENAQRLGRQQSFGLWALENGHGRDLLPPGKVAYDFLED